jgi:hypothetical protein
MEDGRGEDKETRRGGDTEMSGVEQVSDLLVVSCTVQFPRDLSAQLHHPVGLKSYLRGRGLAGVL